MNKYNPHIHRRRSIRLKGYDYAQAGLYYVTLCVQGRTCLFGEIHDGQLILNDAGEMVEFEWLKLPERFKNIQLHEYIVMPNHFHAILKIARAGLGAVQAQKTNHGQNAGQPQGIAHTGETLGKMVGAFQSITTVEYIRGVKNKNWQLFDGKLWQRNYWEHIIRNEKSYQTISEYIVNNPAKWGNDELNTK